MAAVQRGRGGGHGHPSLGPLRSAQPDPPGDRRGGVPGGVARHQADPVAAPPADGQEDRRAARRGAERPRLRPAAPLRGQADRGRLAQGETDAPAAYGDPAQGGRVLAGPAPQPLAAVLLEWDARTDLLHAVGTQGGEMFDAFFEKYAFRLEMELGQRAKSPAAGTTVVKPASEYSRQWQSCRA